MKAEIITVGTELLMGQIVNTNSSYLAKELAALNIPLYFQQVVGDNANRLSEALALATQRSEIIILTGGLGPTTDDITKQTVATFLQTELVEDQDALEKIIRYHQQSKREMPLNNRLQSLTFKDGQTLWNHNGLAVGSHIEQNNCHYIVLPGPPYELKRMFELEVRPLLQTICFEQRKIVSRFLRFFAIGESRLVTTLADIIEQQTNPTIAPYASQYEVMLRLTANGDTEEECVQLLDELEANIQKCVGTYFYSYGENTRLVHVVANLLKEKNVSIAAAESLTGGLFQAELVSVPGISDNFKGGVVAYQNKQKEQLLNIPNTLLETYGAVSKECASAMALNIRLLCQSTIGISFTGVAGPEVQENHELGTVFIGISTEEKTVVKEFHFARDRNGNREFAVQHGLNELRKILSQ